MNRIPEISGWIVLLLWACREIIGWCIQGHEQLRQRMNRRKRFY